MKELFIREFDIDIQTDIYAMACFIVMLMDYEYFQSMPWEERVAALKEEFNVDISSRTLQKWYAKLLKKDLVAQCKYDKTYWATMYINGEKQRIMVSGDECLEQGMKQYYSRRKELVAQYKEIAYTAGRMDFETINSEAWGYAFKTLWQEYHCCYYQCGSIYLNAIGEHAQEIYELVDEISYKYKPCK